MDCAHRGSVSFCAPKFKGVAGSELWPETSALAPLEFLEHEAARGSCYCGAESSACAAPPLAARLAPSIWFSTYLICAKTLSRSVFTSFCFCSSGMGLGGPELFLAVDTDCSYLRG